MLLKIKKELSDRLYSKKAEKKFEQKKSEISRAIFDEKFKMLNREIDFLEKILAKKEV